MHDEHDDDLEFEGSEVAVVGIACRFPGAETAEEYWRMLRDGVEGLYRFSEEELMAAGVSPEVFKKPNFVPVHGVIPNMDHFDAGFFGYSPREAEVIDPQQRCFLETAWHALEDAGCDTVRFDGKVGVYGGITMSHYMLGLYPYQEQLHAMGVDTTLFTVSNEKDSVTTRVNYKLDLTGPGLTLQTGCSTSLVAIHVACQNLLNGECDLALAGAVSQSLPSDHGYHYTEGGILSPDGHCKPFDAEAEGTVFGNAVGVVALKRLDDALEDGDHIYCVVRGSALNNDGSDKVGYTAPSVKGQAQVIVEALAAAGVEPSDIGFVEGHATATTLGDPIEVSALNKAFGKRVARHSVPLGSVKGNIGHTEVASGVAGFIKAALSVYNNAIPPTLHYRRPNPRIDFDNSPFFVNTELMDWAPGKKRMAGVSSFGFGGTNAHAVLEEAPELPTTDAGKAHKLFLVSARSPNTLAAQGQQLADHLERHPNLNLADVAYSLQVGRRAFEQRRAIVCREHQDAIAALRGGMASRSVEARYRGRKPSVALMFSGQGSQHPNMAARLYQGEPVFRQAFDRCAELFKVQLAGTIPGFDLVQAVYPTGGGALTMEDEDSAGAKLQQTEYAQSALFTVETALAELWKSWGLEIGPMIGHSIGEYAAAHQAGVLSLEDAVALVSARVKLMKDLPGGAMLSVPMAEADLQAHLNGDLALAAVNAPGQCVVSGPADAVAALKSKLDGLGVEARDLHTSHAFHSAAMDPILDAFRQAVAGVTLNAPDSRYVSTLTGTWIGAEEVQNLDYWVRHLRETVRFGDGVATLFEKDALLLLEVGPGTTLTTLASQHAGRDESKHAVHSSLPHPRDPEADDSYLLKALGTLWCAGVDLDWQAFNEGQKRRKVPLPGYPYERQRYVIDVKDLQAASGGVQPQLGAASLPQSTPPQSAPAQSAPVLAAPVAPPPQAPAPAPVPAPSAAKEPDAVLPPAGKEEGKDSYVAKRYSIDNYDQDFVAAENEIQEVLVDMWENVLGVQGVGIRQNFFALGGNSLVALQVISRIQEVFQVKLNVRTFFESPTVEELAQIIENESPDLADQLKLLEEIEGMSADEIEATLSGAEMPAAPAPAAAAPAPAAPAPAPQRPSVQVSTPAPAPQAATAPLSGNNQPMDFSLFFFSGDEEMFPDNKYELVIEAAKWADANGFSAIWTPERHFNNFGSLYPAPAVLSGAISMVTERIKVRSGSVVLPMHHPMKVAEEWSVVDNLSHGRAEISFASGFHPDDFVFNPDAFQNRRELMFEKIQIMQKLWRGETFRGPNGVGREVDLRMYPTPVQKELPVWVTCASTPGTFERTAQIGGNVLTSMIGLTMDVIQDRVALYRDKRAEAGFDPATGQVSVMLHAFVGDDMQKVMDTAREPFITYLRSHTNLLRELARSVSGDEFNDAAINEDDLNQLLEMEFERYFHSASLMGTPESCLGVIDTLRKAGVNDLGCLLDFGVSVNEVMDSLEHLKRLKEMANSPNAAPTGA